MYNFITRENPFIKEKYLYLRHPNGMHVTLIPKDMPTKYACVCCNFGSFDATYIRGGETVSLPSGTAHFLEHKMFENPDGSDSFLEFDRLGGSANAYTSFENTCFYFSCGDNFYENLAVLLKAVGSFHVTKRSVDRERSIITREMMMYDDSTYTLLNQNLMYAMYGAHPIALRIGGTPQDVALIDKKLLSSVFDDFYTPDNLSLAVMGDVDPQKVASLVDEHVRKTDKKRPVTVIPRDFGVTSARVELEAPVGAKLYAIGFPCPRYASDDLAAQRKATCVRMALTMAFGRSSDFFCRHYDTGKVGDRFGVSFTMTKGVSHIVASGSGDDPDEIAELVAEEIEKRKKIFFTKEQFDREKRAAYADNLMLFDMSEELTGAFAADVFDGYDEFDCIEALKSVTYEECAAAFNECASTGTPVISVLSPNKNIKEQTQ